MTIDPARLRLYLVADVTSRKASVPETVAAALRGGVTAVQLRAKAVLDRETLALGSMLRNLCDRHDALFLVNDRLDLALLCGADGVHLGVHDIAPVDARRIGGSEFIVGYSPDHANDLDGRDADYLGIGPVYGTRTKADAGNALGIGSFRDRVALTSVPVVGIGGITAARAPDVLAAGACGVAVVSAIMGADDPEAAAAAFLTTPGRSAALRPTVVPRGSVEDRPGPHR